MAKTRHIQRRMNQRGIKNEMMKVVEKFGVVDGDKIIFNKKGIDASLQELELLKKDLVKARSRGGFVLVEVEGVQITAYSLDSYKRMHVSNDPIY